MLFSKPTDLLTSASDVKPIVKQEPEKEKSVGMLSVNKRNLVLVKPKSVVKPEAIKVEPKDTVVNSTKDQAPNALGLLGAYSSDSE